MQGNTKQVKNNPEKGRRYKYLQIVCLLKIYYSEYIKTLTIQQQKDKQPISKEAKTVNRHFSKKDIQMANKHMKRHSAPLVIREMQIKTSETPLTLTRMAIIFLIK